jgi:hypothetical protein
MNENEQVPIAEQIELAVDKTLDSAKDIAYARYETFEKQGLVNSPTLEALLFFIDIAFEESALDGRQRIEHPVFEPRTRADIAPLPRARGTKLGYYIVRSAIQRASRGVLAEGTRETDIQ